MSVISIEIELMEEAKKIIKNLTKQEVRDE